MDSVTTFAKQLEQRYQRYHLCIKRSNRRLILTIDEPESQSNLPRMVNWILAHYDGEQIHVNLTPHVTNSSSKAYSVNGLQELLRIINDFCEMVKCSIKVG